MVAIVAWLRKRRDVDPERIALLTHGDGKRGRPDRGREGKEDPARSALLAAPGLTGREVVLEQQRQALARAERARSGSSSEDRAAAEQSSTW